MARLPQPGGDAGQWGEILNDFLSQSISTDGSLNISTVGAPQLKPGAVTNTAIANGAVTTAKVADGAIGENQLADDSVSVAKLKDAGQANGPVVLDGDALMPVGAIPMQAVADSDELKATIDGRSAVGAVGGSRLSLTSRIEKARSSRFTVMLYGMSIANAQTSPAKMIGAMLQRQYGSALPMLNLQGFSLGGSYNNTFSGWTKQRSSGPGFGRARGGNTATALTYTFFGDTVIVDFSRETNSEAANILIDGATVGTTPAAGAQAFSQMQTFTVTRGVHTVTIPVPTGAGYVYFERLRAFDSAARGVHVIDNTLGGSLIGDMVSIGNAGASQSTPIPTVGDAGLIGHFDRDDVDAYVVQHDVNDAGKAPQQTYIDDTFIPALNKIIALTAAKRKPLLLISSMAGAYALANKNSGLDHANYERIRALYAAAARDHNHVEHLDWHAATIMDDLVAYAARYYPSVTGLNVAAGTWTNSATDGDFIHPNTLGHTEAYPLVARTLALPAPTRIGSDQLKEDQLRTLPPTLAGVAPVRSLVASRSLTTSNNDGTTDTLSTATAHGLAVGDRLVFEASISGITGVNGGTLYWVIATPSATTFQVSLTQGGASIDFTGTNTNARVFWVLDNRRYAIPAGAAVVPASSSSLLTYAVVPFYRDTAIPKNLAASTVAAIEASSTSDEYGKYVEYTALQNLGLGQMFADPSMKGVLTMRARGTIELRNSAATAVAPDGSALGTNLGFTFTTTEPIVAAIPFYATAQNHNLSFKGRVYEIALTYGSVPVLI